MSDPAYRLISPFALLALDPEGFIGQVEENTLVYVMSAE